MKGVGILTLGFVLALNAAAGAAPITSVETYTTKSFTIVPENVAVVQHVEADARGIVVAVRGNACMGNGPTLTLLVHGATLAEFRAGDVVATGVLWVNGNGTAAIRHVGADERKRLGCTLH
jgi:hypothetical protein